MREGVSYLSALHFVSMLYVLYIYVRNDARKAMIGETHSPLLKEEAPFIIQQAAHEGQMDASRYVLVRASTRLSKIFDIHIFLRISLINAKVAIVQYHSRYRNEEYLMKHIQKKCFCLFTQSLNLIGFGMFKGKYCVSYQKKMKGTPLSPRLVYWVVALAAFWEIHRDTRVSRC